MHRRQWVCEEHNAKFPTRDLFITHVKELHSAALSEEKFPILLEISERQLDETEIVACPLCPDERRFTILENHLAEHLESIALFVFLPDMGEAEDGIDSDGAVGGSGMSDLNSLSSPRHSNLTARNTEWENLCVMCEHDWHREQLREKDMLCPNCSSDWTARTPPELDPDRAGTDPRIQEAHMSARPRRNAVVDCLVQSDNRGYVFCHECRNQSPRDQSGRLVCPAYGSDFVEPVRCPPR
jgi:Zn finger protein HypA/HybF involved in hydrogenase expression